MPILNRPARLLSPLTSAVQKAEDAGDEAKEWAEEALDHQARTGILTRSEAREAKKALDSDETAGAIKHLGAHTAISVPLRFPLGSIARFLWTAVFRVKAEVLALFGRLPSRRLKAARNLHSLRVAAFSAVPGVGTFAYVVSEPIRKNRPLLAGLLDETLRKLPFGLYESQHLGTFTRYLKNEPVSSDVRGAIARPSFALPIAAGILAALMLAVAVLAGADPFPLFGVSVDNWASLIIVVAGLVGCVHYFLFWRLPDADERSDAALNFFWAISGVCVVWLGLDGALSISEELGKLVSPLPLLSGAIFEIATGAVPLAVMLTLILFSGILLRFAPDSLLLFGIAAALSVTSLGLKLSLSESTAASVRDGLGLAISALVVSAFIAPFARTLTTSFQDAPAASRRPRRSALRRREMGAQKW